MLFISVDVFLACVFLYSPKSTFLLSSRFHNLKIAGIALVIDGQFLSLIYPSQQVYFLQMESFFIILVIFPLF